MILLVFKSLHIIGFVSWFAGLFYLVRMFVNHEEAYARPEPEAQILARQFALMEQRVYKIIINPAMMITWTGGLGMLFMNPSYLSFGWMHLKLLFLILLMGYHFYCKKLVRLYGEGQRPYDSFQLRLLNEVPTVFLASIVFLAVFRTNINYLYLFGGLLLFAGLMYRAAAAYKKRREKGLAK